MKHATRIKAFALGCALLAGGGVAAHLWGAPPKARADAPLAAQECTLRAPVDTTRYFGTAPGAPWDSVRAYMAGAGLDFTYGSSTMLNVRLCGEPGKPSCRPFVVRIESEASNICLGQETAQDGRLRMLGRLNTPRNAPVPDSIGGRWGFTKANASGVVYLLLRGTTAYAMYDSAGVTAFAPAPAWKWSFCAHARTAPYPEALWKQMPPTDTVPPCDPTAEHGGREDPEPVPELTSYGWMACVSGCCRFYGSPPPDDPDVPHPNPRPRPRPANRPAGTT